MSTVISPADRIQFGEPLWHADGALLALGLCGRRHALVGRGTRRLAAMGPGRPVARTASCSATWKRFGHSARGRNCSFRPATNLVVWDVAGSARLTLLPQPSWVTAVAFHPTRRVIATGHDDGSVRFGTSPAAGSRGDVEYLHHEQPISALAFNADGSMLASAAEDREIAVWDLPTGEPCGGRSTGHTDRIPALAWQPGTNVLLSAGWDTTVRVWDLATGEPTMLLNTHSDQVYTLAFSPDGKLLAVADSSGSVHVWSEIAQGKELRVLPDDLEEIH